MSPEEHLVEQYEWVEGKYRLVGKQTDTIEVRSIPGVRVDLTKVW